LYTHIIKYFSSITSSRTGAITDIGGPKRQVGVDGQNTIWQTKEAEKIVLKSEKIKALVGKTEVKKIVFVPNKLINIVI